MSGYILKPADGEARVTLDWRRGHLDPGETLLADLGWSIDGRAPVDLVVVERALDSARSSARLGGGTPGRFYLVASRVRTSRGRVLERSVVVRVALGRRRH